MGENYIVVSPNIHRYGETLPAQSFHVNVDQALFHEDCSNMLNIST